MGGSCFDFFVRDDQHKGDEFVADRRSRLYLTSGYFIQCFKRILLPSNIRYGDPPIGDLRFAAPRVLSPNRTVQTGSNGDRRCFQANPGWLTIAGKFIAPYLKGQTEAFYGQYPSEASFPKPSVPPVDPTETEDCLFLDVKVSRNVISNKDIPNRKAPVLVWIHGGGFTGGYKTQYSSDSLLAQSRISRNVEVVFVQLNYRLGAFGFLSGVGVQGNVGLLDQRLALQWVQKHIDQFGGDPRQVTVMGESAGAGSIEYHLTARDAVSTQPLFQHAIMQSPFFFPDQGQVRNLATYNQFLNFAANYRIVLDAPYGQFGFGPVVDQSFIVASPATQLLLGRYTRPLPQLLGHNTAEGLGFTDPWVLSDVDFTDYVRKLFPAASLDAVSYITNTIYPPPKSARLPYETSFDRAVLVTSDVVITCNTYLLARAYQNKTYNYLFDVPPGLHGDDLHYTFGPDSSVKSERVRLAIQDYVMSFTATRSPNSPAQPSFPMYGTANQALNLSPASIEPKPDTAASTRCLMLQKHVWS